MSRLARATLVALAYGAAISAFTAVQHSRATVVVILGVAWTVISAGCAAAGWSLAGSRKKIGQGVWLIDVGWVGILLLAGAAATALLMWLGVAFADQTTPSDPKKVEPIGAMVLGGAEVILGILFLKDFKEGDADNATGGFAYPGAAFRFALQRHYRDKFDHKSVSWRAVWEQRLSTSAEGIKGWGFKARRQRAALIKL